MLSDRPYMRGDYQRETTSVATWLICAIAGAFVLQFASDSRWLGPTGQISQAFVFSVDGLTQGKVWTLLTYWLLHSTTNLFHVSMVVAGLFLLGRELMGELGPRRFLGIFAGSILCGAFFWAAVNGRTGGELMGSTAGLYGLLAVYALLYPNREISLLLFFFFPITFRPKHVAAALLLLDASAMFLIDVLGRGLPFAYAPSAHLGGMMAGWAYFQFVHSAQWRRPPLPSSRPRRSEGTSSPESAVEQAAEPSEDTPPSPRDLRAQVDRVLDKINSEGLGALTPAERRILDNAKEHLSRR